MCVRETLNSTFLLMRELYEADFHKPGISGSGRVLAIYRVGRVASVAFARWSRSSGYCGFRGVFWVRRDFVFSIKLYFQIRENDRWLRETQSSQRRLVERTTTTSQPAHRELALTDPHRVYHLLCSHLRIMASVYQ